MKLNKLIAALKSHNRKDPNVRVRYNRKEVDVLSIYQSDDKKAIWIDIALVDEPSFPMSLKDFISDLEDERSKGANPKVKWAVDAFADDVRLKDLYVGCRNVWIDLKTKKPKRR